MVIRGSLYCYDNNCQWPLKQPHLGIFQGVLYCSSGEFSAPAADITWEQISNLT